MHKFEIQKCPNRSTLLYLVCPNVDRTGLNEMLRALFLFNFFGHKISIFVSHNIFPKQGQRQKGNRNTK